MCVEKLNHDKSEKGRFSSFNLFNLNALRREFLSGPWGWGCLNKTCTCIVVIFIS